LKLAAEKLQLHSKYWCRLMQGKPLTFRDQAPSNFPAEVASGFTKLKP